MKLSHINEFIYKPNCTKLKQKCLSTNARGHPQGIAIFKRINVDVLYILPFKIDTPTSNGTCVCVLLLPADGNT